MPFNQGKQGAFFDMLVQGGRKRLDRIAGGGLLPPSEKAVAKAAALAAGLGTLLAVAILALALLLIGVSN